ncbi:hypothetical protein KFK09_009751 [Dendrobium nobile]|uniref:SWIM-type domain-containing protein n=1 Tax=Dendrobium nobile TaxID=94219 RepID=A0A8T3BKD4_DENNO|nr:hypothetical protein KFK09_009751 [Dendrobium nobile]
MVILATSLPRLSHAYGDNIENNLYGVQKEYIAVVFKFGGIWVKTNVQHRKRYDGGKQRTVKVEKGELTISALREEICRICPWLKGHPYTLYYYIYGTSPKEYKEINSEVEETDFVKLSKDNLRAEIVITVQEVEEHDSNSNLMEVVSSENMVECSFNDVILNAPILCSKDIAVDTYFLDALSFKNALRSVAIRDNFGVRIKASDKKRVIATCSYQGYNWRIRASLCEDAHTFQVRRLDGVHTCPDINRAGNKLASSAWVANEIEEIVKRNPDIPPKDINNNLEKEYGLSLPYMKLWRSRKQALDNIFGSIDDNYKWVSTLQAELVGRNPGSHITYMYDSRDNSFQRFYVSFKVCVDGFKFGCRPLISLDACHLKSKHLGMLLSATSVDGYNGLFPLGFAVVETKSKNTWLWFLQNLGESIGTQIEPLAFISDMEKGLGDAIKEVYSTSEHIICIRHLWKNIKKKFHWKEGHKLQGLVWGAANAYTNIEYTNKLAELCVLHPNLHAYLMSLPYKWSRSQFKFGIYHNTNTNNFAESFNAWIVDAKNKPVVDLIDMIHGKLMEQRATRKITSSTWHREFVPHAEEYIREITTMKDHLLIRQSSYHRAEVESLHCRHIVDIETKECTCNVWQLTGLPCIHAIAFIGKKEHPLWHTYVNDYYYVYRYRLSYDGAIAMLPGKDQWQVVQDLVEVGAPNTSRPRGRPKRRRLPNFLEKERKVHKCSRCGLWGHHRSTCKNPLKNIIKETLQTQEGQSKRSKLPSRRTPTEIFEGDEYDFPYVEGL